MKLKFMLPVLLLTGLLWLALVRKKSTAPSEVSATLRSQAPKNLTVDAVPSLPTVDLPQRATPSHLSTSSPMPQNAASLSDALPNFKQAQPARTPGNLRWLTTNEAASIPFAKYSSMAKQISFASVKPRNIKDREDAATHLEVNVAMALRPSVAFEDADCYYYSGGTTAYSVDDFSAGIIVHKATGVISAWVPLR